MIKQINPQNILISPFIAAKSRALSNTANSDIVILEQDTTETIGIALEYIDYNFGTPLLNRDCNIALEQQSNDLAMYQEGVSGSGTFNSQSAVLNGDGTYKVLVYNTVKNLFYNTYNNPTEILGLEHIDFPLSNTLRNLSQQFRMFSIPQSVFGDRIQPKSVQLFDELLDDNIIIFDDGNQNLIAGYNLFSKVQEVHTYPAGFNPQILLPGAVSLSCPVYNPVYFTLNPSPQGNWTTPTYIYESLPDKNFFTASFTVSASAGNNEITFQWYSGSTALVDNARVTGSLVVSSSVSGSTLQINDLQFSDYGNYYCSATDNAGTSFSSNGLLTVWDNTVSQSMVDTMTLGTSVLYGSTTTLLPYGEASVPTFGTTLRSGLVVNNVFYANAYETASVSVGFDSGLLFNVLVPSYGGQETASVSVGFDSGQLTTLVGPYVSVTETPATFAVSLLTGSVF